jgi:hypothetical protein
VLKKTSASAGLVIVTAAGALLASSPAYALDSLTSGSHVRIHHRSHHRNRNWNGNRHHGRIFIRIYIYNKNNNHAVAVARPERRHRRPMVMDAVPEPLAGGATREAPVGTTAQDVPPAPAPAAETNQAPASTTADQTPQTAPAEAPATAPLDEAATG